MIGAFFGDSSFRPRSIRFACNDWIISNLAPRGLAFYRERGATHDIARLRIFVSSRVVVVAIERKNFPLYIEN